MLTGLKAVVKGKLGIGKLTGKERIILSQLSLPDRVPTIIPPPNIEPCNIDANYNYVILSQSVQSNLELFEKVCDKIHADLVLAPGWMGIMFLGAAEMGTKFKITEDRVPYPYDHPIKNEVDLKMMKLPTEPTGYFKMYLDLTKEAEKLHPETFISIACDGPWDLAMLLRGDHKLPMDMRLHKDYYETDDPVRKGKIKKIGNPDFYPQIMDFCTNLSIRFFELAKENGVNLMGASIVDQFAASPVMSPSDFFKYVSPYIDKVNHAFNNKLVRVYPCSSPHLMKEIIETQSPGAENKIQWANYNFDTLPNGVTLPEFDRPAFELAKKYKKGFIYIVHGKFIRDATEDEIEELLARVLPLGVELETSLSLVVGSVPPRSRS